MSGPEAVFARARSAVERGDWETFFACLDRSELLVIARNRVEVLAATPPGEQRSAGGGSVSSRLFVGETLDDLAVEGAKARARRRLAGGSLEDVAFVKKNGDWYIRLPKRRA